MPPQPTGAVQYKKKDGRLDLSDDGKYLFFTPAGAKSPTVTTPVAEITNLQQTGAASAKVALKVFVNEESYVFSFTGGDNARKEQEAVTDALRNIIAANKAQSETMQALVASPSSHQNGGAGDAAQASTIAIAKAMAKKVEEEAWYDDDKLKAVECESQRQA
jgi:transcription initiation factor TFIIH subunit 1